MECIKGLFASKKYILRKFRILLIKFNFLCLTKWEDAKKPSERFVHLISRFMLLLLRYYPLVNKPPTCKINRKSEFYIFPLNYSNCEVSSNLLFNFHFQEIKFVMFQNEFNVLKQIYKSLFRLQL